MISNDKTHKSNNIINNSLLNKTHVNIYRLNNISKVKIRVLI